MTIVIGTAGHIDHGKTSLLLALTGIDADRLPEERRRGMTIDVGYAHLRLPDGDEIDFVDVPGHDRLVGNMLVGAGEIDAALLVVAADDGPRAQTLEHLALLDALGIRHGLAAVTKSDIAGPERSAAVATQVRALLGPTILAGAPVVIVSSAAGTGLDRLREELASLRDRVRDDAAGRPALTRPRMAIDRAFSVRGRGRVVTGSLRGGPVAVGQTMRVEPGGDPLRVRGLEVHGHVPSAPPVAGRVALNVAGPGAQGVARGSVVTTDPLVRSTDRLLVSLRPPVRLDPRATIPRWPPSTSAAYRLHLGTASEGARLRRGRGHGALLPDGRLVAMLTLTRPVAAASGDRFVLRQPSPATPATGGVVLDVTPPGGPSRRRIDASRLAELADAVADSDRARVARARLALHGVIANHAPPMLSADLAVAAAGETVESVRRSGDAGLSVAELRGGVGRWLRRQAAVDEATASELVQAVVDTLVTDQLLSSSGDTIHLPGHVRGGPSPAVMAAMTRLEGALSIASPPGLAEAARAARCPAEGIRELEASRRIVRVDDDLAWSAAAYAGLRDTAVRLASAGPLTPAALRDATGTSRKYIMALLEDLDRRAILRRTPAGHVPGPRASSDSSPD